LISRHPCTRPLCTRSRRPSHCWRSHHVHVSPRAAGAPSVGVTALRATWSSRYCRDDLLCTVAELGPARQLPRRPRCNLLHALSQPTVLLASSTAAPPGADAPLATGEVPLLPDARPSSPSSFCSVATETALATALVVGAGGSRPSLSTLLFADMGAPLLCFAVLSPNPDAPALVASTFAPVGVSSSARCSPCVRQQHADGIIRMRGVIPPPLTMRPLPRVTSSAVPRSCITCPRCRCSCPTHILLWASL
jgi:hypothetical protein